MALKADELAKVLTDAQREVARCTSFCRLGSAVEGGGYSLHHNGIGSSDTSSQVVHAVATLALGEYGLKPKLVAWLTATHDRQGYDLNAG